MVRIIGLAAALMVSTALTTLVSPGQAAPFGTRDEAVAMVKRVIAKFKKDGPDATFQAINSRTKEFWDRDLYPFVLDMKGVNFANGGTPSVRGKDIYNLRDQDGRYITREMIDIAKNPGHGWANYRWLNPVTHVVDDKSAYVERMGDYWVAVGIYRNEQVNENTVAIMSGSPNSDDTYLQMAYDLAAVLNDKDNLRILPMVGIGGPQNIRDVRDLKGVDIGITQSNVLNSFRHSNEQLGVYDDKIVYIAELFNEEAHVVARSDITSMEQLQGQKVNLDEIGSGSNYSMRDVFQRLGIKIEEVNLTQVEALDKLRTGEIAATVLIAGKPARSMNKITSADGFHFLPIPFSSTLVNDYLPATLSHDDYPEMVAPGQSVDTIAVTAVLIAYNWPKNTDRYRRVKTFVEAFFPRIAEFQRPPRHIKWREVNLAAKLPGWNRFEPAETWLENNRGTAAAADAGSSAGQPPPRGGLTDVRAQDEALYQEFLKWKRTRQPN